MRTLYKKEDDSVGYRCPGEPVCQYLKKGGSEEETKGRMCLCNSLIAAVGYGQIQKNGCKEKPLLTAGKGISEIKEFIGRDRDSYTAHDVIKAILC